LVTVSSYTPVSTLVIFTRAVGMAASLVSLTLPEIVLFPLCADASEAETRAISNPTECILYFIDRE
jgi:hypothetical protein